MKRLLILCGSLSLLWGCSTTTIAPKPEAGGVAGPRKASLAAEKSFSLSSITVPILRTNYCLLRYAPDATNKTWRIEGSSNLLDWVTVLDKLPTDSTGKKIADPTVFRTNGIKFWRMAAD